MDRSWLHLPRFSSRVRDAVLAWGRTSFVPMSSRFRLDHSMRTSVAVRISCDSSDAISTLPYLLTCSG
jgi:hypothetical protein